VYRHYVRCKLLNSSLFYAVAVHFPGGEIVSTFDMPDSVKLGHCDLIEEVIIGEDRLIKFSGKSARYKLLKVISANYSNVNWLCLW
jgi:hypothetical protein